MVGIISHLWVDVTINHRTIIQPSGISYINGSLTVTDTLTNQGQLYLEGDLINEGVIDCDSCLSGVTYLLNTRDQPQTIRGSQPILLHDGILDNSGGVQLENQLQIANTFTFIKGIVSTDRSTPTQFLHFLPSARVVNATNKLHVDGFVARTGSGAFLLPTGDGSHLRPMGINPSSSSAMVKAAYINPSEELYPTLPNSDSVFSYTLSEIHTQEYWKISSNATTSLTLNWDTHSQLSTWIQSVDSLVVAGWNGRIWKNLGQAYVEGNLTEGRIQSFSIDLKEFEAISLGKNSFEGERPESWISFEGSLFRNDVQLDWTLAYENYTEKYIVERAIDRRFFQNIGEVEATKNGTAQSSYRYVDPKIAEDSPVDALYYRLKKVGLDAAYSYSSIIEIGLDIKANVNLVLYPNPAITTINLELNYLPFNTRLQIFNSLGQGIYKSTVIENQTEIDVSNWPDGQYYAVVKQEGYSITKKFYVYH